MTVIVSNFLFFCFFFSGNQTFAISLSFLFSKCFSGVLRPATILIQKLATVTRAPLMARRHVDYRYCHYTDS